MSQDFKRLLWHISPFLIIGIYLCIVHWFDLRGEYYKWISKLDGVMLFICSLEIAIFPFSLEIKQLPRYGLSLLYFIVYYFLLFFSSLYIHLFLTGDSL